MTARACPRDPTILRLSLPPGTAPEVATLLVQHAVAEHYRRRHALDSPAPTPSDRRPDLIERRAM